MGIAIHLDVGYEQYAVRYNSGNTPLTTLFEWLDQTGSGQKVMNNKHVSTIASVLLKKCVYMRLQLVCDKLKVQHILNV